MLVSGIQKLIAEVTSNSTLTIACSGCTISLTFSLLCYCIGGWCLWLYLWGWVIGGLVEMGIPVLSSLTELFQLQRHMINEVEENLE